MGISLTKPEDVIQSDFVYAEKTPDEQASYVKLAIRNEKLIDNTKELVMMQADRLDEHIRRLKLLAAVMRKTAGNNFAQCEDHQASFQLVQTMDTGHLQLREAIMICNHMHGLLDHGMSEDVAKSKILESIEKITEYRAAESPSASFIEAILSSIFR